MSKLKKFTASFQTRSLRVGGYSVVATAIVLAIVIAANVLIGALPTAYTELDITANQFYSISDLTKQMLKNLDQDVTIYWICQSGVEDAALQTLLDRYVTGSSHVKLERIDPDLNPTFTQKYPDIDFSNNSLIVLREDRYRYVGNEDIYLEELDYNTYENVYTFDGENAITSAIDFVISQDLPKLYFLSGHQEVTIEDAFKRSLELENFLSAELNLSSMDAIPEDADLVLICAPASDLSEKEASMMSAYLAKGGDLMLLSTPSETESFPNLYGLLDGYGVSAVPGVIFEGDSNYSYYSYPHYLVPNINEHSITQPLIDGNYGILIPEAHGLTIAQQLPENTTVTGLLETSASAYSKVGAWPLTVTEKESGDIDGPFQVAVAIQRSISESENTNILWVSSIQLLTDSVNSVISGGNLNLFMNCVNWASEHTDRISIRGKDTDVQYLTISSASASTMTLLVVGIIPLSFLAVGIYLFIRRKRK